MHLRHFRIFSILLSISLLSTVMAQPRNDRPQFDRGRGGIEILLEKSRKLHEILQVSRLNRQQIELIEKALDLTLSLTGYSPTNPGPGPIPQNLKTCEIYGAGQMNGVTYQYRVGINGGEIVYGTNNLGAFIADYPNLEQQGICKSLSPEFQKCDIKTTMRSDTVWSSEKVEIKIGDEVFFTKVSANDNFESILSDVTYKINSLNNGRICEPLKKACVLTKHNPKYDSSVAFYLSRGGTRITPSIWSFNQGETQQQNFLNQLVEMELCE